MHLIQLCTCFVFNFRRSNVSIANRKPIVLYLLLCWFIITCCDFVFNLFGCAGRCALTKYNYVYKYPYFSEIRWMRSMAMMILYVRAFLVIVFGWCANNQLCTITSTQLNMDQTSYILYISNVGKYWSANICTTTTNTNRTLRICCVI